MSHEIPDCRHGNPIGRPCQGCIDDLSAIHQRLSTAEERHLLDLITHSRMCGHIPGDPECDRCNGEGTEFDDDGNLVTCGCSDGEGLRLYREKVQAGWDRVEAQRKADEEKWWIDNHGHARQTPCPPGCTNPDPIPF